jgi:hypothetical protein
MQVTSSHLKIKKNEMTLLGCLVFFMRSNNLLHINNEVKPAHLENILAAIIFITGLARFTSLLGGLTTSCSNYKANAC